MLNLTIGPDVKPGQLKFAFNGAKKQTFSYELRARNTEAGRVQGLSTADMIYFVMPDRFSNGDPKNDVVKGTQVSRVARDSMYARHGGDLKGIANHFDYIKQLGATAIWSAPWWRMTCPKPATTATP